MNASLYDLSKTQMTRFRQNNLHCMIDYATDLFSYQQHTILLNKLKTKECIRAGQVRLIYDSGSRVFLYLKCTLYFFADYR